jgi:general secretion pathway protein A
VASAADESKVSATVFPLNGDSKLVWVSGRHRQILKTLDAAIHEGRGLLLLTGESGSGKTVLIRALLNGLVGTSVRVGWLPSPDLESVDLHRLLGEGLPGYETSGDFLGAFRRYLRDVLVQGQRVLLVVDDAQALRPELFAELRRLLEVDQHSSGEQIGTFNILLIGRPELETMLREPRYGELAELIRVPCTLRPLTTNEVAGYVQYHLGAAGFDFNWFTLEAMEEVWTRSGGIPRTINVICEQTLQAALLAGAPMVDAELVRQSLPEEVSDLGVESKGLVHRLLDIRRAIFANLRRRAEPEAPIEAAPEEVDDLPADFADEDRRSRIVRIGGVAVLGVALALGLLFYFGWRSPSRDAARAPANGIVEREVDRSDTVELPEKPEPSVVPSSPPPSPLVSSPPVPPRAAPPPSSERPRAVTAERASPRGSETAISPPAPPRAVTPATRKAPSTDAPEKTSFRPPVPAPPSQPPARGAAPAAVRSPAQDEPDPASIIDWLLKQGPSRPD